MKLNKSLMAAMWLLMFIVSFCFWTFWDITVVRFTVDKNIQRIKWPSTTELKSNDKYIVHSDVCEFPNILPFDKRYPMIRKHFRSSKHKSCGREENNLTILENGILRLDEKIRRKYFASLKPRLNCSYAPILRKPGTDYGVIIGTWLPLTGNVSVTSQEFIAVKCVNGTGGIEYRNIHTQIVHTGWFEPRLGRQENEQLNVVLLGVDSVSRLSLRRHAPELHEYLTQKLGAVPLLGYNKVGENTLPNLIPILSGKTREEMLNSSVWNKRTRNFDEVAKGFIWSLFAKSGYKTFIAEDEYSIATFNWVNNGFKKPPADHYFRPAMTFIDKYPAIPKNNNRYCYGSKRRSQILLDWAKDYLKVYQNQKSFAWMHFSAATHDHMNGFSTMKEDVFHFLKSLAEEGLLKKTLILFYADHGFRLPSEYVKSQIGDHENKAPFFYLLFPKGFLQKYKNIHSALKINSRRLTSNSDIHRTLLDILHKNFDQKEDLRRSDKRGRSLLSPVPFNRTCEAAGIPLQFCLCHEYKRTNISSDLAQRLSQVFLSYLNNMTTEVRHLCITYKSIILLRTTVATPIGSSIFVRAEVKAQPGSVPFDVHIVGNSITNQLKPIAVKPQDWYSHRAKCVKNMYHHITPYCLCKNFYSETQKSIKK